MWIHSTWLLYNRLWHWHNSSRTKGIQQVFHKSHSHASHRQDATCDTIAKWWQRNGNMIHTDFTLNLIHLEDVHHALLQYVKHYLSAQESLHYSLKSITLHSAINFLTWFVKLVPDVFPHYINSVLSWITRICKSKQRGASQALQV
jgi:hypothetical protein